MYDPSAEYVDARSRTCRRPQIHEEEYPFSFLAPSGEVLTIGPSEDVSYDLNAGHETWTSVGSQRDHERVRGHVPAREDPLQRRGNRAS